MEFLTEEMPPPLNQEFSLVLRENKVGIPLEESLNRLNKRMKLEELELLVSSILVARETGGDLTKVFSRLANTMRDKRKLKDQITTLTLQGKIQGVVMSILPIAFILWVLAVNKHHFDIMLRSDVGRMLLLAAGLLQLTGMFLMAKFSKIDF
jgi:tight adherence protein B